MAIAPPGTDDPGRLLMTASDLSALIQAGESDTVELKQSTGATREIVETVSAFANARGGTLLIGVTNTGTICGVTIGQDTLEALSNTIQQQTDSKVFPVLTTAVIHGKTVVVLRIEESPLKPVLVQGRGFKRIGRSNHVLSSTEVAQLSLASWSLSWDTGPAEGYGLAHLDPAAVRRFLVAAQQERHLDISSEMPLEEALEKLDLWRNGQPMRAGLLLFGREPQRFLRQSEVRVARFKGVEPLQFLDMQVIEGGLIAQRAAVMAFIQRHISMAADVKGLEREERWEYPLEALREAVTNALCHRDYRDPGNVQVRIFDDRLEVWNPGTLPPELSLEALRRTHRSVPRNRLIAHAFFLIKFIEQWGTGTLRMIEACREAGLPEPEFAERSGAFVVTFRQSKLTREYLAGLGLSARQIAAVEYIQAHGRITNREYVALTHVARPTATRDLTDLVAKGLVQQHGKGRGSYFTLV
jgi:ATP-dependent DNA helicase RecG